MVSKSKITNIFYKINSELPGLIFTTDSLPKHCEQVLITICRNLILSVHSVLN